MRLFCHNKEFDISNAIFSNVNITINLESKTYENKERMLIVTSKSRFAASGWVGLDEKRLIHLTFVEARKEGSDFIGIFRVHDA